MISFARDRAVDGNLLLQRWINRMTLSLLGSANSSRDAFAFRSLTSRGDPRTFRRAELAHRREWQVDSRRFNKWKDCGSCRRSPLVLVPRPVWGPHCGRAADRHHPQEVSKGECQSTLKKEKRASLEGAFEIWDLKSEIVRILAPPVMVAKRKDIPWGRRSAPCTSRKSQSGHHPPH